MSAIGEHYPPATRTESGRVGRRDVTARRRRAVETSGAIPVMGPANRAPGRPVMGAGSQDLRRYVMGGPDTGQRLSVMGAGDQGTQIRLFGESDLGFVDSLFASAATGRYQENAS